MGDGHAPEVDVMSNPQRAIFELGRCALRAEGDEEGMWQEAVEILRDTLDASCVGALRCSSGSRDLELVAVQGADRTLRGTHMVGVGEETVSEAALGCDEPVVVEDLTREQRYAPSPLGKLLGCHATMAVAVAFNDTTWGVCEFHWEEPRQISEQERVFAGRVASLFGEALSHIRRDLAKQKQCDRFILLVEHATDLIGLSDLDGRVTYLNQAGCELVGLSQSEVEGLDVVDFLPEDEGERFFDEIMPIVADCGRWEGSMCLSDFRSEQIHHTEATVLMLEDPDSGEPVGHATIQRDVTERVRLREQLRQSQKLEALGLLAGGVAHDFNNHLTVIKGYSELILSDMPEDEPRRAQLEKVRNVSVKAQQLADQLLTFSRRKVRQPTVFDLNKAIDSLLDMLRSLIGETITIEVDTRRKPCFVELDPSDMEQVILNLAVNARDAIHGTGKITVKTGRATAELLARAGFSGDEAHLLQVSDTGIGMPPEVLERAFEPFFTTKGAHGGTGLGLVTVCRIVTDAGGKVVVDSTPDRGTTFNLLFPPASPPAEQPSEEHIEHSELGGDEVILVIEDDPDVLEYITEVLEQHGYDTIPCGDGRKAVDTLTMFSESIDAVLSDVVLPNLTPQQLRAELIEAFPDIPVVMTSGYGDYEQLEAEGLLEDVPFLSKPMAAEDLLHQIRTVLDRPNA